MIIFVAIALLFFILELCDKGRYGAASGVVCTLLICATLIILGSNSEEEDD